MKKVISVFLAVLMLVTMLPLSVFAENTSGVLDSGNCGADGDNVTWTLYKDGELVIIGEGEMADYNKHGYNEYKRSAWSAYADLITKVTIESGITSIGNQCFYNDSIFSGWKFAEISLPEGVISIGERAFYNCDNLISVKLPNSLEYIERSAFMFCTELAEINIPENTRIYTDAFYFCSELKQVIIPFSGDSVSLDAFCKSGIEKVIFAEGIQAIESKNYAFSDEINNLNCVVIPSSVTEIKDNAFSNCPSIDTVFFRGTEEQWNNITFGTGNGYLINAENIIFDAVCHDYETTVVAPTCTEKGYTHFVCKICSDNYIDNYIDSIGHTEEIIPGKAATCTETGLTDGKKCFVCGEILTAQIEIPAPGHNYTASVTEPTCTEDGFTIYTCPCGDAFAIDEVLPAIGHTPGEWEVVTDAQIGIDGLEQQKCTVCGEVLDERVIPALPDEPTITFMVGDANSDGKITAADARIVLRISAKLDKMENYNLPLEAFDVTGDGKLTAADARKVLRISAKLEE